MRSFGCCYWLTGLPAAGKTTLARSFRAYLVSHGVPAIVLDGDDLRAGLNADLQFDRDGRAENVRRIGEVARVVAQAGYVAIVSAVSPFAADRDRVRSRFTDGGFFEVFMSASLDTCMARDPKGLYRQAREGQVRALTGYSAPYEQPVSPELVIDSGSLTPQAVLQMLVDHFQGQRAIAP